MQEGLTSDTIKGTLMRKEPEYYFIQDKNGEMQRIHVDKSTKLDKVNTRRTVAFPTVSERAQRQA